MFCLQASEAIQDLDDWNTLSLNEQLEMRKVAEKINSKK
jgi:hypothetical protein